MNFLTSIRRRWKPRGSIVSFRFVSSHFSFYSLGNQLDNSSTFGEPPKALFADEGNGSVPKTFAGALLGLKGIALVDRTPVADRLFKSAPVPRWYIPQNRTVSASSSEEIGSLPAVKPQNTPVMSAFDYFVGGDRT